MNYIKYKDGHTEEIIEYNEETMYFQTVSGQIYRLVEYTYSNEKIGFICKDYAWQRFLSDAYGGDFYNTDEVEQAIIYKKAYKVAWNLAKKTYKGVRKNEIHN